MFCKMCGKEIPDGKELCDECATKAQNVTATETTANNAAQNQTVNNNQNTTYSDPQKVENNTVEQKENGDFYGL